MKDNLPCAVVRDLLPIYVEGLTEPETNAAVEAHLKTCPACTARLAAMRAPEPPPEAETAKEVDYLKKVKRRSWKRVVLAVLVTVLVLMGALAAKVFIIGSPPRRRPRRSSAPGPREKPCGWRSPLLSLPTPTGAGRRRLKTGPPTSPPGR